MKKIILLIIILVFLTGCGIFNLDGWVWPDDPEFLALIQELDTPYKISQYMRNNFTIEVHYYYAPNPYTLWKTGKGDCNDFATFGIFIANYHGYETYQIHIITQGDKESHFVAVYVENTLSYTDGMYYLKGFASFKEIAFNSICNLSKYIVYDYWNNKLEVGYNE